MDHYIKEELKIKYYVRYQDDFLLFHESKEYLKICMKKVEEFLEKEKLKLNKKTRIYNSNNNFIFLGRTKNGRYARYRTVKRRLKKKKYHYERGYVSLYSLITSKLCYKNLLEFGKNRFDKKLL